MRKYGCDNCNADLTETGNSVAWRLALKVERIPSVGGFVTDMHFEKPLDKDAHFCNVACLENWISERW